MSDVCQKSSIKHSKRSDDEKAADVRIQTAASAAWTGTVVGAGSHDHGEDLSQREFKKSSASSSNHDRNIKLKNTLDVDLVPGATRADS